MKGDSSEEEEKLFVKAKGARICEEYTLTYILYIHRSPDLTTSVSRENFHILG